MFSPAEKCFQLRKALPQQLQQGGTDGEEVMAAAPAPEPGVQRLTEYGYDVMFSHDVPFPPFMKPAVLDEVCGRRRACARCMLAGGAGRAHGECWQAPPPVLQYGRAYDCRAL